MWRKVRGMPRSLMTTVTCVQRLREVRPEVPVVLCTAHARARIALHRMVEVGELKGITQEEDRCVVSNHVPISLVRIELHGEAANIALGVRRATLTGYRREASKHRSGLADIGEDLRLGVLGDIWRRTDKSEQPFASRRDMRAVLDVLRRPESFCRRVVTFVEESVEGFENDRLILFGCCLWHGQLRASCDGW